MPSHARLGCSSAVRERFTSPLLALSEGEYSGVLFGVRVWRRAFRLFSANPLLRDELMIKPRYLYFVAIVEDFILRCVCVCRRARVHAVGRSVTDRR